ncbi:hypothetical protein FPSE_08232 [Fusarium pseudograminearum CS3096]|uniref:Uncharacterized protein n=1 Tax=Fusarium pseudograminearum (strain CS3096) TaxID=1028729 RepID=K3VFJ1_FUSPC|nr:hypothetical protein FPSE_08232 [Fusarium pseudograminearum CS3096]EKJ71593.1 hypothetical protein FPSE_08232 [Fusarium pseudograminearum CS3096]
MSYYRAHTPRHSALSRRSHSN